jgi:hypothetical protein
MMISASGSPLSELGRVRAEDVSLGGGVVEFGGVYEAACLIGDVRMPGIDGLQIAAAR